MWVEVCEDPFIFAKRIKRVINEHIKDVRAIKQRELDSLEEI